MGLLINGHLVQLDRDDILTPLTSPHYKIYINNNKVLMAVLLLMTFQILITRNTNCIYSNDDGVNDTLENKIFG
jgi:hypothetical protein